LTAPLDTHVLVRAFVDELARCGMQAACTSPGSRSTPLLLALVRDRRLRCYSHIDERCAGFFAVGHAKATGRPVAITCTSGTAAAELTPAVVEAWEARVPIIVLTADRPPELREVGAGQSIDQLKLYGSAVKWFFEMGEHTANADRLRWVRSLACRAYWTALDGRPGPVHLNWGLREPLVPDRPLPPDSGGRPYGAPWLQRPTAPAGADPSVLEELALDVRRHPHGIVVAGRHERDTATATAARELAQRAGYPLLADPLSGARGGCAAIAHYDALLRGERFAADHVPQLVLRVGDLPTSKALRQWLASLGGAHHVAIDAEGSWHDPSGMLVTVVPAEPARTLAGIIERLPTAVDNDWLAGWREADERARGAIAATIDGSLSEPGVARLLGRRLPTQATLFVASSMPVRDVETFWEVREDPPRVLSNRGANGIDGTVSAAFGAAADSTGPVVLLIGDVALAHDLGGLLAARRLGLSLTIVLTNNGGGAIFDFLTVASQADAYEEHVATPPGLDFGKAAALFGLDHVVAADLQALEGALEVALQAPGAHLLEVRTDRAANVAVHRRAWAAVAEAVAHRARTGRGA